MGYSTCSKCGGDGELKCPKCGGSAFAHGLKRGTNELLGINEEEQCTRCHDLFVVTCNECGGTGKVKDDADHLKDKLVDDDDDEEEADDYDYDSTPNSTNYQSDYSYSSSYHNNESPRFNLVGLFVCLVVGVFSYYIGVVHNDGMLFRGFFMQLLAIVSSMGVIAFFDRTFDE